MVEDKTYKSDNSSQYGLKREAFMLPSGVAINRTKRYTGSVIKMGILGIDCD